MVAGTAAADTVPPHPARQLIAPRTQTDRRRITRDGGFCIAPRSQRDDVAARVETLVRAHPLHRENVTTRPCSPWPTAASPCTP